MFSKDGGETWDIDSIILGDEVSSALGYPASVELKNGDILTVFYSKGNSGEAVIKQVLWNF